MKKLTALAFSLVALPLFAADMKDHSSVIKTLSAHWKTSKEFTLAVAAQMPAESYSFKLTPAQMSFAEQMSHIATAQGYFFSMLAGGKSPIAKPANLDKETILKLLNDSFDYGSKTIDGLSGDQLAKEFGSGENKMTGLEVLMLAFDHTTNHRASAEMYLRSKGITPTEYKF